MMMCVESNKKGSIQKSSFFLLFDVLYLFEWKNGEKLPRITKKKNYNYF